MWRKWVKAEKFVGERNKQKRKNNKGKGGRNRFKCDPFKYLHLFQCEASCVNEYHLCLDARLIEFEDCLQVANQLLDPGDREDYAGRCRTIVALDYAECAAEYAVCGLGCMLPVSVTS